jgi:hypothetical protein
MTIVASIELYRDPTNDDLSLTFDETETKTKTKISFEIIKTMAGYVVWKQIDGQNIAKIDPDTGKKLFMKLLRLSPLGWDMATGIVNLNSEFIYVP